jgi:hypothetical protein
VLLDQGGKGVNVLLGEDTRVIDFTGAPSEDEKMLLNCLEHGSHLKV